MRAIRSQHARIRSGCHKCPLWIALYTIMFRCLLYGAPILCMCFFLVFDFISSGIFFIDSISIDNTRNRYWRNKKIRHSAQQKGNLNASIFSSAVICDSHSFASIEHNDETVRQMIETSMWALRSRQFLFRTVCAFLLCDALQCVWQNRTN